MIIGITIAAFVSTFLGGLFAIAFKDKLHLILGFSAGAVIGVAFFDLLPEAIELTNGHFSVATMTSIVAFGFIIFMILDRFVLLHSHHSDCDNHHHVHESHAEHMAVLQSHGDPKMGTSHTHDSANGYRGKIGAGSLAIHSFLDGAAIGLAFQISVAVGVIVAVAVLVHDFSDGINTVNLILKNGGTKKQAFKWLAIDAVAPVLGVISTLFFTLPKSALGVVLACFCGFFIYIGASDLLPESHHNHPTFLTTFMTILGAGVLYIAIHVAGV